MYQFWNSGKLNVNKILVGRIRVFLKFYTFYFLISGHIHGRKCLIRHICISEQTNSEILEKSLYAINRSTVHAKTTAKLRYALAFKHRMPKAIGIESLRLRKLRTCLCWHTIQFSFIPNRPEKCTNFGTLENSTWIRS